jgi:integrase/recombinase XerC/integrase/recombinase XerD
VAALVRDRGTLSRDAQAQCRGSRPAQPQGKGPRKGGAVDIILWKTGTARLLPGLIKGRRSGPLLLTDRRARVELSPADIDPATGRARLSYRQAENLF